MIYITVLFLSTFFIFFALFLIWHKTKEISFVIGILLIFFFTFLGGWFITIDLITNNIFKNYGLDYYYLYDKMFPVYLDGNFHAAIILYFLFIIFIELTVLILVKRRKKNSDIKIKPICISHTRILFFSAIFTSISITVSFTN